MIMCRRAGNDFDALRMAEAVEKSGAIVFSISYNGMRQLYGAMKPSSEFIVWARVKDKAAIERADLEINKALEG